MSDDPKDPTPPQAAADKPASDAPGEPLKAEVSRTDSPGAGVSAAPTAVPADAEAPKPANPAAATTATTSEVSSATGLPSGPAAPAGQQTGAEAPARATAPPTPPKPVVPPVAAKPAAAAPPKPAAAAPPKPAAPKPAAPAPAHDTKPAAPAGPPDPPPPAAAEVPSFIRALQAAIPAGVTQLSFYVGDWTVIVPGARLIEVAQFLRDTPETSFDFCSDVTASDWPPRPQRFDVIYCLYSTRHRHRVRLKVRAGENEPVASVSVIWPAANWLEREVYDLFGVNFIGHPDRRRILMPDDWQGFPQRKDYPLEGPGELLMENPLDWLKLKQAQEESEIE